MEKLDQLLSSLPTRRDAPSNSLAKWESSRTTQEQRINAIQQVVGLCGAPALQDGIVVAMAEQLRDLSRVELERAVELCARDEELVRAIRFGGTVALSDFYRVLRGSEPETPSLTIEEAAERHPALAEAIRRGEITSVDGRKITGRSPDKQKRA